MKFAALVMFLLAMAVSVGQPVCCAFGDCTAPVAEESSEPSCCCCGDTEEQAPITPAPREQCVVGADLAAPPPATNFDELEFVALLDLPETSRIVRPVRIVAPRSTAPPLPAHLALNLPLLL